MKIDIGPIHIRTGDDALNEHTFLVTARCIMKKGWTRGSMLMTFADTNVEITDRETGKKLGRVFGALGGSVGIETYTEDDQVDELWTISAKELWLGFAGARAGWGDPVQLEVEDAES